MSTTGDGGPAFPVQNESNQRGMSLRAYFAGQALIAWGAGRNNAMLQFADCRNGNSDPAVVAHSCVAYADAMIAAMGGGR